MACLLLSLNLLAFLFHTVLDLVDDQYRAIRQKLGTRRRFFQDLDALLRYFEFKTWDDVLTFMFTGLELDTGPRYLTVAPAELSSRFCARKYLAKPLSTAPY